MHGQFRRPPRLEVLEDRFAPGNLRGALGDGAKPDHKSLVSDIEVAAARPEGRGNSNPGVAPIQSHAFGQTYGEWAASFNQWSFSLPVDEHPLFDTADISTGQTGRVWFLGGTFTAFPDEDDPNTVIGIADRTGTVPAGTALFFPIVAVNTSELEGNGSTEAELRDAANSLADAIVPESLTATVDGRPVEGLISYRAESPLFEIGPLPDNNILQAGGLDAPEGATSPAVADGVFLLLRPLPVGEHTIHFTGTAEFTEEEHGFDLTFKLDITYTITVAPPGQLK
jgi:hypothetical protein